MRDLNPDEIEKRQDTSRRFGLVLGAVAAVLAFGIELFIAPKPLFPKMVLTAALMALLNIPLGIALGLLGERVTREKVDDGVGR